jgi:hypothetical protein
MRVTKYPSLHRFFSKRSHNGSNLVQQGRLFRLGLIALGPVCLGFYWLSTGKSMSNETNGVASTTGFTEASSRTGRRGKAHGEVLPAALHIRGETFSATRHIVELKLQGNATADQLQRGGSIPIAWADSYREKKKRGNRPSNRSRQHRGDALGFHSRPRRHPSCRPRRCSPSTLCVPRRLLPSVLLSVGSCFPASSSPSAPLPQDQIPSSPAVLLTGRPPLVLSCSPPRPPSSPADLLLQQARKKRLAPFPCIIVCLLFVHGNGGDSTVDVCYKCGRCASLVLEFLYRMMSQINFLTIDMLLTFCYVSCMEIKWYM